MLCGVGGRTIAEAKHRLSYTEFLSWVKYRNLRGRFNVGMRVESGTAQLAMLYANSHSRHGGYKIFDFMPHEAERAVSLDEAVESWL